VIGLEGEARVATVGGASADLLPSTEATTVVAVVIVFGGEVAAFPDDSFGGRVVVHIEVDPCDDLPT